jgi:hypothetical protein
MKVLIDALVELPGVYTATMHLRASRLDYRPGRHALIPIFAFPR